MYRSRRPRQSAYHPAPVRGRALRTALRQSPLNGAQVLSRHRRKGELGMTTSEAQRSTRKKDQATTRWGGATIDREEVHQLRREALFSAAARAFNEAGYHNTTLDDVARRLNVTKPALYYYVKHKDEILFECCKLAYQHMGTVLDEVKAGNASGQDKLILFLTKYAELQSNEFGACLTRVGLKPLKATSRNKLMPLALQHRDTLMEIIEAGVADGSIRPCDPRIVSKAIFGAFDGIAQWFDPTGRLTLAEITQAFLNVFLEGLRPAKGSDQ